MKEVIFVLAWVLSPFALLCASYALWETHPHASVVLMWSAFFLPVVVVACLPPGKNGR